jgi:predicted ATPase
MKTVITGAPGAGKTSVIEELRKRGYICLPEENRILIKELIASKSPYLPWLNPTEFGKILLQRHIKQYLSSTEGVCFFDRSFIDTVGYFNFLNIEITASFKEAIEKYRFDKMVFFAEPWKEIYHADEERKETFEQASKVSEFMKQAYVNSGYNVISLPKVSASKRADFILNKLKIKTALAE